MELATPIIPGQDDQPADLHAWNTPDRIRYQVVWMRYTRSRSVSGQGESPNGPPERVLMSMGWQDPSMNSRKAK
jgi:hypothetical protein